MTDSAVTFYRHLQIKIKEKITKTKTKRWLRVIFQMKKRNELDGAYVLFLLYFNL